jgi:hypothetical protein
VRIKKILIRCVATGVLVGGTVWLYLVFSGPRMTVQPHIRTYQAVMPLPQEGSVPLDGPPPLPTAVQAANMKNPLPGTPENIAAGKTYYIIFCLACHSEYGDGNGPVGQSYMPAPSDIRSGHAAGLSDGQLLRASLTGIGHEPVLEKVVYPDDRWYIVLYVRSLQKR